jgi:bacteriocin biosynthesis cyclodehydratase domain-containing protein
MYDGPFGRAAAERMSAALGSPSPRCAIDVNCSDIASTTAPFVFFGSCERPGMSAALDESAFRAHRSWIPVVFEHPMLRIGPLLVPPHGPCLDCFTKRRFQHNAMADHTLALHAAYTAGVAGPAGYLPQHVELSVSIAVLQLAKLLRASAQAGEMVLVNVLNNQISTTQVVAVHACARCSQRDRSKDSFELIEQLMERFV